MLFTPLSFSPDHFSLFLAPSPLSSLSISLSYSFKSTVSIVSLIFNLSIPPILHFFKSFAFNESVGSQRCLTQNASEVLHHRNWQHDSPIIACQRWFADAPSLFSPPTPPPRSPSLVLSLLPSSARGGWSSHKWCWASQAAALLQLLKECEDSSEGSALGHTSAPEEIFMSGWPPSRSSIWADPHRHTSRAGSGRRALPRGGSFLCHQTLWGLNSGQERERERETSAWAVAGRDARGRYWSLLSTSSDLLPVHSMQVQFTAFPHFLKFFILEMFGFALCWIRVMRLHLKWHLMYFGASWSYKHTVSWSRAAQTTCRHLLTTFWPLLSIFSFLMSLIMSINPRLLTISRRQTHFPHHLPNINWCVSCFKERLFSVDCSIFSPVVVSLSILL